MMGGPSVAQRVRERLSELGLSAHAASLKAGLSPDAIRDILTGKSRNPRGDTLAKIAKVLNCDPGYLLGVIGDSGHSRSNPRTGSAFAPLAIRFDVAAGAWLAIDDMGQIEPETWPALPLEAYGHAPQWLERVQGDSMDRLLPAGALVHVIDGPALGYVPRHGDLVVAKRSRAQGALVERSVKQVELTPEGVQLWPRSHNPKWGTALSFTSDTSQDEEITVEIAGKVACAYLNFER